MVRREGAILTQVQTNVEDIRVVRPVLGCKTRVSGRGVRTVGGGALPSYRPPDLRRTCRWNVRGETSTISRMRSFSGVLLRAYAPPSIPHGELG